MTTPDVPKNDVPQDDNELVVPTPQPRTHCSADVPNSSTLHENAGITDTSIETTGLT